MWSVVAVLGVIGAGIAVVFLLGRRSGRAVEARKRAVADALLARKRALWVESFHEAVEDAGREKPEWRSGSFWGTDKADRP